MLERNPVLARRLIDCVDPALLTAATRAEWVSLLRSVSGDEAALATLGDLRRHNRLPADLIPTQLQLAQVLGDANEQIFGMIELKRQASIEIRAHAIQ
jgi:hypothetical protein